MRSRLPLLTRRTAPRYAALAALACIPFASVAQGSGAGDPGPIQLTGAWAGPITGTTPVCTPEPAGRRTYGTDVPFDWVAQQAESIRTLFAGTGGRDVDLPNVPSVANMDLNTQAGAHTDYCVGFTLNPNQEDQLVASTSGLSTQRYAQTSPPLADLANTHALDGTRGDDLQSARVTLPDGFAAAADSTPQCTDSQFGTGNSLPVSTTPSCAHAVVGTGFVRASTSLLGMHLAMGGLQDAQPNATFMAGGILYNLTHSGDEFARLGVTIKGVSGQAPAKFVVRVVAASDGSGRLEGVVVGAPRVLYLNGSIDPATGQPRASTPTTPAPVPYELYVESVGMRIWGAAADHPVPTTDSPTTPKPGLTADFAQNGTECTANAKATVQVGTYGGSQSSVQSQGYTLSDCTTLAFNPSVSVTTPVVHGPGEPTGLTVKVDVAQSSSGRETALLRDASVTLPAGLEVGAQVASRSGGLKLCSAAQFAKTSTAAATCPADSVAANATVQTPLLNAPLVGKAYLGEQSAVGELPALYLEFAPAGASPSGEARIKLVGTVSAAANGQVTATFTDAPQLRFSSLELAFPDGPDALFVTPRSCGTASGSASIRSWASATPVARTFSMNISQGCSTPAFGPQVAMSADDQTAGGSSPTTVTLSRPDASPWMKDISVALPSGFLADLNKASECSKTDAAAGTCADASRIATVTATAGAGSTPFSLTGKMFLVDRDAGSVAGASILVRAKLGDLDLGDVIVPAKINLRPTDAGLTLTTTAPTRFHNLPLLLRTVTVKVDRPDFPVSPTACGPLPVSGSFVSDQGDNATATAQITYTGCAAKPFSPTLTPTLTGDTTDGVHPSLNVKVAARAGDSNLKGTTVKLPDGLGTDGLNIKNACSPAQFEASTCPATTKVGTAKATVKITPDVISGDVYLVTVPGKALPGLGLNFTGRYAQRIMSTVQSINDRIQTTFDTIPDLPLTSLDLTVDGGPKSPLLFNSDICKKPSSWDTSFTAQGGQTKATNQSYTCTAGSTAVAKATVAWFASRGFTFITTAASGKTLQSVKFTLPKGFRFAPGRKAIKRYLKVVTVGGTAKVKITNTSISLVRSSTVGPTGATVKVKARGIRLPKSKRFRKGLKKGVKVALRVRTAYTDGTSKTSTLTVTVR